MAAQAPRGAAFWRGSPTRCAHELSSALRQVISKLNETMTEFGYPNLEGILLNYQRSGTDPVYEPLRATMVDKGIAELTRLGEIYPIGVDEAPAPEVPVNPGQWHFKFVPSAARDSAASDARFEKSK